MPSNEEAVQFIYSIMHAWMGKYEEEYGREEDLFNRVHESMSVIMDGLEINRIEFLREFDTEPEPEPTFDNNTNMEI